MCEPRDTGRSDELGSDTVYGLMGFWALAPLRLGLLKRNWSAGEARIAAWNPDYSLILFPPILEMRDCRRSRERIVVYSFVAKVILFIVICNYSLYSIVQ